jgi:NAD(P)-dependent dehydrogenase (short-subunit alcohol dehydrogenase family)
MLDLKNKVAVVTGAASGIGRALAEGFAQEGMQLVLADVEPTALEACQAKLSATGARVISVVTDVSRAEDVERLAGRTMEQYGAVHVVCNNAGVAAGGLCWEQSIADWQWVLGVNLWGVIHGIRTFVPLMLKQGGEGHVINTASIAGLITGPAMSIYGVSKHAVVALSETLHHELGLLGAQVGVSVLCPAWVKTNIADSDRNRPPSYPPSAEAATPQGQMIEQVTRHLISTGIPPSKVAEDVIEAIRAKRFYIFTHPEFLKLAQQRFETILAAKNPEPTSFA